MSKFNEEMKSKIRKNELKQRVNACLQKAVEEIVDLDFFEVMDVLLEEAKASNNEFRKAFNK
jgi:hypothetical protein